MRELYLEAHSQEIPNHAHVIDEYATVKIHSDIWAEQVIFRIFISLFSIVVCVRNVPFDRTLYESKR